MKFVINGIEYEGASLERITGRHALDLAKYAKVGVAALAVRLDELQRLSLDDDGTVTVLPEGQKGDPERGALAVFGSEPHLKALLALIWMSRRINGKEFNLTWDQVLDEVEILRIGIGSDDDEEEPEPEPAEDPTPPSASAPESGGKARASRPTSKGSTTSKRTSRRGS